MRGESLDVAGEDESRAGDVWTRDVALHPRPRERLERQNVLETLDETTDGELGLHAVTRLRRPVARLGRCRVVALRAVLLRVTCALSLPNAIVSAGPKKRPSPRATRRRPRGACNTSSTRREGPSCSIRTMASTARPRRTTRRRNEASARCCRRGEMTAWWAWKMISMCSSIRRTTLGATGDAKDMRGGRRDHPLEVSGRLVGGAL